MLTRHFCILDVAISLSGPPAIVTPIATAYGRFAVERRPADAIELIVESQSSAQVDGRSVRLLDELDPTLQVYQHFLNAVYDHLDSHVLLHAAALGDGAGGAFLLAAPGGHGKTSLTLELVQRGRRFLSDDFAPLDPLDGRIHPYPRTVGVLPVGGAPIPAAFRKAAEDPAVVKLLGKSLLDVGRVAGEQALAREPLPLRTVILLSGSAEAIAPVRSQLEVACRREAAETIETRLTAIPGVTIADRRETRDLRVWRIDLEHARGPTAALSRVLDHDGVLFSQKLWDAPPDFSAEPAAVPLRRREAAELLAREILNRRPSGRLLARYDGKLARLFVDLAAALRPARCWLVTAGRYAPTADLIEALVDGKRAGT
ncbi:MAG TPA: hypothetical protein VJS92_11355 [Candidatus Polarisedimenticolaceae bacterium]|nr:hypothetical protein [Candidatus Polarisedimenticolaceae bacterium]